jgi:hypothetical protein
LRWRDDPDALPAGLGADLARYRELGPSAAERARMLEGIGAAIAAPEAQVGSGASVGLVRPKTLAWLGGVLGIVCLSLLAAWVGLREPAPRSLPAAAAPRAPAAAVEAPAVQPVLPEVRALPEPPPAQPARRPRAQQPKVAPTDPAAAAPAGVPALTAEHADPAAELTLLTRARRLAAAAPAEALSLTAEHAEKYPRGVFMEERELIAVEALAHAGRAEEARTRASAFLAAHPRSAHGERMRVIVQKLTDSAPAGR